MKACRVGTSIWETLCLAKKKTKTPVSEPTSGIRTRSGLDRKRVQIIVRRFPILSAKYDAPSVETAVLTFTTRKMIPRSFNETRYTR